MPLTELNRSNGIETVIFEAFEASPRSEDVLAAENALLWEFPGRAAEIEMNVFLDPSFQESLAEFLEKSSSERLARFAATSMKAGASLVEERDTGDPAIVTQFLMPVLEALGDAAAVPVLRKRVRDDVHMENPGLPWRRLPFWLVVRVATQRQLCLGNESEAGRACYKFLVSTLLAEFLEECEGRLAHESVIRLRNKLCRRLAKLEMEKKSSTNVSTYEDMFTVTASMFQDVIGRITNNVEAAWVSYRRSICKPVPQLPQKADESSLRLTLPNSGATLENMLRRNSMPPITSKPVGPTKIALSKEASEVHGFNRRYFNLAKFEKTVDEERLPTLLGTEECQDWCQKMAAMIDDVFHKVGDAYESIPEQMSIFILTVFDLWVRMDRCALLACPLLGEYHPVFSPELLDALQLPSPASMLRLQLVQTYLRKRIMQCRFKSATILSRWNEDSFVLHYLQQSTKLKRLEERIQRDSKRSLQSKTDEWTSECGKYDELSQKISEGTCVCTFNADGSRNVKGCKKCWRWRTRKRMSIGIHEDYLPTDNAHRAAVVFELGIPGYLAAYRATTWKILRDWAHPERPRALRRPVALCLDKCQQLRCYTDASKATDLTLASAKKSFTVTHFKKLKMKVSLNDILLPFGAEFSLYDAGAKIWVDDLTKPLTIQHLCGIHIPHGIRAFVQPPLVHPPTEFDRPSSYQIMANQTECPSDMSVHEFTTYQKLVSATALRWPNILVELGSSGLNFSCEDTMHLLSQLASQAGPQGDATDHLRVIHAVFGERLFCQRLTEQIRKRLVTITPSWREWHCMEILITLSLRLVSLASPTDGRTAVSLLVEASRATLTWISRLRHELGTASEAEAGERAASYAFRAALLCRRTFAVHVLLNSTVEEEGLERFLRASIALRETLVVDIDKLPQTARAMMIRDAKLGFELEEFISNSVKANPASLNNAVSDALHGSVTLPAGRAFEPWQFLDSPNQHWVTSAIITAATPRDSMSQLSRQTVQFNYIEGHLLVDGQPLRRLPASIRNSPDVKELFGELHLLTCPSSLTARGMTHKLLKPIHCHEIHFGHRGEEVVIMAGTREGLLEFIPRRLFITDIPSSLVENCVHWLNHWTWRLEVRRKPNIWKTKRSDWIIDISRRRATRKNGVSLVDPHSPLFKSVTDLFRHFETHERITVFQPPSGKLAVELRHLQLSFFVNRSSLLQCRELNAEIDPNQDIGTMYGLQSKIILRDAANKAKRSIIVPLGRLEWKRNGMHVAVVTRNAHAYGRFYVDEILGRLSCVSEPLLLHYRAIFHALTSFVLPDPLTGRTGTEEAVHILQSGRAKPWTPLSNTPAELLVTLQNLCPNRVYYPQDKRRLQKVTWDKRLTTSIQHDCIEPLVQNILSRSNRLKAFNLGNKEKPEAMFMCHLRRRANIRRLIYECGRTSGDDKTYESRDRTLSMPQAVNAFQITKVLLRQPFRMHAEKDLRKILEGWKIIGGFHDPEKETSILGSLHSMMEDNVSEQWGSLVDFCCRTQDRYSLIFRLSLLSFAVKPDVEMVKFLAAFACLDQLKLVKRPMFPSFVEFGKSGRPTAELLQKYISLAYMEFEGRSKLVDRAEKEAKHAELCEADGRRLANMLLDQWPNQAPSADGFESSVIDVDLAMEKILPEWERSRANRALSKYIKRVQAILALHNGKKDKATPTMSPNRGPLLFAAHCREHVVPPLSTHLRILTNDNTAVISDSPSADLEEPWPKDVQIIPAGRLQPHSHHTQQRLTDPSPEMVELRGILSAFAKCADGLRKQYANDLSRSLDALEKLRGQRCLHGTLAAPPTQTIRLEIVRLCKEADQLFIFIENLLWPKDCRSRWLRSAGLWHRITPMTVLELLRSNSGHRLPTSLNKALIRYGVLVTRIQQHGRVIDARMKRDERRAAEDWQQIGHENWNPMDFPDWLLLEIDANLLIRPKQVEVARAIISPASRRNSVLQMNMGQGKQSFKLDQNLRKC